MAKQKRNHKKEASRLFERAFDFRKLDYATRIKPIKNKAMIFGFGSSAVLYTLLYLAIYTAFVNNALSEEYMAKLVWTIMVPTTVGGMLVWQIAKNRFEYPVRMDIRAYIEQVEAKGGLLWRFFPLWEAYSGKAGSIKKAFVDSEKGLIADIAIEDYTDAVKQVQRYLSDTDNKDIPDHVAEATVQNFNK